MSSITIQTIEKPEGAGLNDALQWLCRSIGLFTRRDRDNSCFRVFIELLKETKRGNALSSDELAARLSIVRGTVVHHLNRLRESGIVKMERRRYSLRADSLHGLVSGLKRDACVTLDQLEKVASELDKSL